MKKRPFLGRAIVNGKIRYTSVSQIKTFDPTVDGGCPRKWAYAYVFGIKLERTDRQKAGSTDAELLEHYLKTGEDVLSPTLQPAKKLFPVPGKDLECELPFGDIERAVALRDDTFTMKQPQLLQEEIERAAGLTLFGIPVDGAADLRHRRGEFIDSDKILKKDPPGLRVVHIEDLKTVSRIFPHKVLKGPNAGNIIPAYTKTDAEVCEDPQMVGYARHGMNLYPDATHFRLGHIYASTTKREAEKRTGIISVEQVLERTARLDGVVGAMTQVAQAQRIEDVQPNTSACDSYTHVDPKDPTKTLKGCGYRYQCPLHITQVVNNMLGTYKESAMSLMDQAPGFGTPPSAPVTNGAPAAPPMDPAAHQAAVEAEKARLRAQLAALGGGPPAPAPTPPAPVAPPTVTFEQAEYGYCPICSAPLNRMNGSKPPMAAAIHIDCPKVRDIVPNVTISGPPAPVPVAPSPAPAPPQLPISVNPPDQPRTIDMVAAADPPPPGEIAQITDPALRAQMEQHAREHAARAAALAAQQEAEKAASGTSVWCTFGSVKIPVTGAMPVEGYTCTCGKHWSLKALKPSKEGDGYVVEIPRHKPVKKSEPAIAAPQPVQTTMPTVVAVAPVATPAVPQIPTPVPVPVVVAPVAAPVPAPIPMPAPSIPVQTTSVRETKAIIKRTEQAHRVVTESGKVFCVLATSIVNAMTMAGSYTQENLRGVELLGGEVLDVG